MVQCLSYITKGTMLLLYHQCDNVSLILQRGQCFSYIINATMPLLYCRCFIDGYDSGLSFKMSPNETEIRNLTVPWDEESGSYSQCKRYSFRYNETYEAGRGNGTVYCERWVYDLSQYHSSIVSNVRTTPPLSIGPM